MRGASTNSQEERQNKKQRKKKIYEMHRKFNDYTHCTKKKDQDDSNDAMV
jgi:hypothetical protein